MKKKILLIDDDIFYLHLIEGILTKLHFDCFVVDNLTDAATFLRDVTFDLIVCDLHFGEETALQFIEKVKSDLNIKTPLVVLTSDSSNETVEKVLSLGADDIISKPITVKNFGLKVYKLLDLPLIDELKEIKNTLINEKRIGVVVPCYNEEERLEDDEFLQQAISNSSYHICFVNDGSKDNTLKILFEMQAKDMNKISVLNLEKNSGKAEAVRRGILYLMNEKPLDFIGFLDADLSTNFSDFEALSKLIATDEYDMVFGSRMARAGAEINKESHRSIISYFINLLIVFIIKIKIKDTQCGAKIFTLDTARELFKTPFQSRWLFDVEMFIRLKSWKEYQNSYYRILEYPLKKWIHKDGSKLGFKDSLKIFFELNRINSFYKKNQVVRYHIH